MPEIRVDPVHRTRVIVSSARRSRSLALRARLPVPEAEPCPFCPGNESETPREVFALRPRGTHRDGPGWEIRVFPNKYPALLPGGHGREFEKREDHIYVSMDGVGGHEVIVETPKHDLHMADMEPERIAKVLQVYTERMVKLAENSRVRYVLVFRNYGFLAGATVEHPHSQVLALPFVPPSVERELEGARTYREEHGTCVFCDVLEKEIEDGRRIVFENDKFVGFAPFASRVPYELAIYPRRHVPRFENLSEGEFVPLAEALKDVLGRVRDVLDDPAFNSVIHTSPVSTGAESRFHWHIEILPRITNVAGFEWGSGMYINIVSPEDAARHLRTIR
jgi:UDPglucose--hexose-1-phosphate uridylyltransferase